MERSKVLLIGGGGILAIAVAVYLMQRRDAAAQLTAEETPAQEVAAAGASGFNSNIAVNVNAGSFNQLTNRFMPLFGLVGIGVVNTQPTIDKVNVEYNITNLQAPSTPAYMIPGLPQTGAQQSLMDGWRAARGIR